MARYADALVRLQSRLSDLQRELLVAHYNSPNHAASVRELAQAVGKKSSRVVHSQYGKLGSVLRDELDFHAEGQQSYVIASFVSPKAQGNVEWLWVMHPELAAALEEVGWVRPDTHPSRTDL
jgi:hypothetical protein